MLFALTLIWMLICGCCGCGDREAGAFGFSNDRSLVYCAKTFSWGGGAASGGAPLPLAIKSSPGRCSSDRGRSFVRSCSKPNASIWASGYHSPATFHKDDKTTDETWLRPVRGARTAGTLPDRTAGRLESISNR